MLPVKQQIPSITPLYRGNDIGMNITIMHKQLCDESCLTYGYPVNKFKMNEHP